MGEPTIVGRAPPPPPSANAAASYPSPVSPAEQPSSSRPSSPQKKKQVIPPNGALVGRNGRFRLEKTIGQGTYGVVKLASDLVEGNKVR